MIDAPSTGGLQAGRKPPSCTFTLRQHPMPVAISWLGPYGPTRPGISVRPATELVTVPAPTTIMPPTWPAPVPLPPLPWHPGHPWWSASLPPYILFIRDII